jgi:hypothetical protein
MGLGSTRDNVHRTSNPGNSFYTAQLPADFFNFNLFLKLFKINPWKILFASGDPYGRAMPGGVARSNKFKYYVYI